VDVAQRLVRIAATCTTPNASLIDLAAILGGAQSLPEARKLGGQRPISLSFNYAR